MNDQILRERGIMNSNNISIVIPTKDRPVDLKRCLISVISQLEEGDEILLIDGGNEKRTQDIVINLDDRYNSIRIISDKTPNVVYAINLGCRLSRNEIIGIVNDDIEFGEKWVSSVKHWFHELPTASSVGGATVDVNSRKMRKALDEWKFLSRLYDKVVMDGHLHDTGIIMPWGAFSIGADVPESPLRVTGFSGANMVVLKRLLEEVGYFDTIFKYAGAEGLFYLNLLNKGKEVYLVPGCEVRHYPNPEGDTRNPFFLGQDYALYFKMIKTNSLLEWIRKNLNMASFFGLWFLTFRFDFKKYSKLFSGYLSGLKLYRDHKDGDIYT